MATKLNALISSLNSYLNKNSFKKDQNGIMQRYLLEKEGWDNHLNQTKNFIKENAIKGESIAILGSGWLLDVPMEYLMDKYKTIYLIDIIHPSQVTHKYKGHTNIKFVHLDITNGLVYLIGNIKTINVFIGKLKEPHWCIDLSKYDTIISLNILNQLDILIIDKLKNRFKINEEQTNYIRQKIQTNHLESLPKDKSLLISDVLELNCNGKETIRKSLLHVDPPHEELKTWDWVFDTRGRYNRGSTTTFKVNAYKL